MSNRRNVSECPTQIYAAIQPTVSEHDIDLLVCDCILHSFKLMFSFLSFIPNSFLTKIYFFCSMWSITMSMFGHPATKTDVECYPFFIDYISLPPPPPSSLRRFVPERGTHKMPIGWDVICIRFSLIFFFSSRYLSFISFRASFVCLSEYFPAWLTTQRCHFASISPFFLKSSNWFF